MIRSTPIAVAMTLVVGCHRQADTPQSPDGNAPAPAEPAPVESPAAAAPAPELEPAAAAEAPPPVEAEPPAPAGPPPIVADANLTVDSIAADGLELRELACAVDGGAPLLGALAIAGTLAKQKKTIDRCAPKGQAFVVTWTFAGGKVADPVARGGTDAANACIAKAVSRAAAPLEGRCGAVILAGDVANAAATVDAVRAAR